MKGLIHSNIMVILNNSSLKRTIVCKLLRVEYFLPDDRLGRLPGLRLVTRFTPSTPFTPFGTFTTGYRVYDGLPGLHRLHRLHRLARLQRLQRL